MSVCPVLSVPDIRLNQKCEALDASSDISKVILHDLVDTMHHYPGCVGLAAPQIGQMVRAIVIDTRRYRKTVPSSGLIMMINPVIQSMSEQKAVREGCLSVPDFTGNVARALRISVEGMDLDAQKIRIDTEGFEAIVFQHELDHLDGFLFLDRVHSLKTDIFRRKRFLH
ncbi:MAG: peptide deformylase [Chlamydiota bacterium]|nr:peptide deformylase [Chlamydiota bacterium]